MNCGASMGEGYGPMIVTKKGVTIEEAKAKFNCGSRSQN